MNVDKNVLLRVSNVVSFFTRAISRFSFSRFLPSASFTANDSDPSLDFVSITDPNASENRWDRVGSNGRLIDPSIALAVIVYFVFGWKRSALTSVTSICHPECMMKEVPFSFFDGGFPQSPGLAGLSVCAFNAGRNQKESEGKWNPREIFSFAVYFCTFEHFTNVIEKLSGCEITLVWYPWFWCGWFLVIRFDASIVADQGSEH